MVRFLSPLLVILLFSCAPNGGGGGGQHACFPVQPVFGQVAVPTNVELVDYVVQLRRDSNERWPTDGNLPAKSALPGLTVRERQLYSFREFFPDVEDLINIPGKRELGLTTFPGAEHEHDAGADLVAQWFQLTPDHYNFDPASGRTTYLFRLPDGVSLTGSQRLWITNWVLEQLPSCFLYGGTWYRHEQGGGGGV
jgi:hypothetical protein